MDFNLTELLDVTIRAVLSLVTLFLVTKLLGKKQVSQLSLFDYVIGISIGNFAAEMTINLETNEINGIIAVIIFGFFAYLVSYMTMKSIVLRRFFMGTPTVIIQNGKILEKNMKKVLEKNMINNSILIVNGSKDYIDEINKYIDCYIEKIKQKEENKINIKIINCYEIVEFNGSIVEILDKHDKILNTSGEKEIKEVFEDYDRKKKIG